MANYTVSEGDFAAHDKQLAANTADKVTFVDDFDAVEIISDGAAKIYVRVDGDDATIGGARTYLLPAGSASALTLTVPDVTSVSLISTGAPVYSVTRIGVHDPRIQ